MSAVTQLVLRRADRLGPAIGVGRMAIGMLFWVRPRESVRVAGQDGATAGSVTWLARMTAARDLVLGSGALLAYVRPRAVGAPRPRAERMAWVLAGALADTADCASIAQGARRGQLRRLPALAAAGGAGLAAVAGVAAAVVEITAQAGAEVSAGSGPGAKSSSG